MENNEVMVAEVMEEIRDSGQGGAASAVILAGSAIAGALLWNRVIKPVGRMIKAKLDSKKTDKSDANSVEPNTEYLD